MNRVWESVKYAKVAWNSMSHDSKVERNRMSSLSKVDKIEMNYRALTNKELDYIQITYPVKIHSDLQSALGNGGHVLSSDSGALCKEQELTEKARLFDIQTLSSELDGPQLTKEAPWKK